MDYARKFGKKKPSSPITSKSSISLNLDYPTSSSEPVAEEKKLRNWKKWLADRKKHCEVYKKTLGRNENELLLNSGEGFRSLMETRELMEKAADPIIAARIQKNVDLGFWIMPEVLPNHGNPNLPEVEVPPNRNSNIPKLEHISTPKIILEEKGLSVPKEKSGSGNKYLKQRTEELADIISVIEPNPPEMGNLFIQGKNFRKCVKDRKSKIQKVPVIALTTAEETEQGTSEWSINPDAMIGALRIEDQEVVRRLNPKFTSQNKNNGPYNWNIQFSSRVSELVEKKIRIENKGNLTLTFYWRPVRLSSNLFPSKNKTSSFFFDKNKGMILPGQIVQFPIWFNLSQPGVRTENWKLETDPRLSSEDLLFRFWGCCSREDQMENCKAKEINQYLDNRIRDTAIRRILEELIEDVLTFQPPDPPYKNLFLERDIFSLKNPSYFYHTNLVKEFREIYESIYSDGQEWNLSLLDLRQLLLEIEDPELRQLSLVHFVKLCRASLEPSLYSSSRIQKHDKVFDLLCAFANQFEAEEILIKNICFGSCEVETESMTVGCGEQSKSNNLSRTSSGAQTPRKRIKSKKKNRKSLSSTNSKEEQKTQKLKIIKHSDVIFFKEIFYLRIYELLGETISKAFATIDSYVRLNEPEK